LEKKSFCGVKVGEKSFCGVKVGKKKFLRGKSWRKKCYEVKVRIKIPET